jgi:hypothetical protein
VAHPDRVGIRESQTQLAADAAVILDDDIPFPSNVLSGGLNVGPNSRLEESPSLLIDHEKSLAGRERKRGTAFPAAHPMTIEKRLSRGDRVTESSPIGRGTAAPEPIRSPVGNCRRQAKV